MKKQLLFILAFVLIALLVGCGESSGSESTDDFLKVMEDEGYVFEQRDEDSREYYQANAVNSAYSLDTDVVDLYIGYVNTNERWAEVVVFSTEAQATAYRGALLQDTNKEGIIVITDGSILLLTYSTETAGLFNETKTN